VKRILIFPISDKMQAAAAFVAFSFPNDFSVVEKDLDEFLQ